MMKKTYAKKTVFEFHVAKIIRQKCNFDKTLFSSNGNVLFKNLKQVRLFAKKINDLFDSSTESEKMISAAHLNAMGLIDEIFHLVCSFYRAQVQHTAFDSLYTELEKSLGKQKMHQLLLDFIEDFPPTTVYNKEISAEDYLAQTDKTENRSFTVITLEELVMLRLANENPAFKQFDLLFNDANLKENTQYEASWKIIKNHFAKLPTFGPNNNDLITMLKEPVVFSPNSLRGQLDYIMANWVTLLGDWARHLLSGIDMLNEEEKPHWHGMGNGELPPMEAYNYDSLLNEYERFSPDRDWMPKVILMAKTVLVWLFQLSKKYEKEITRLDQIPDEELDLLAQQGFTGLWLIGLWERSYASRRIKQINGNPEAAASAYSLDDYAIAYSLGGEDALDNLRRRLWRRGIRLASDMVPNHTGLDSRWVAEQPDFFIQRKDCPFPQYTFNGENLSQKSGVGVYLEDHYYSKTDCSVVFKRIDFSSGDVRYIYHGNDGTGMPWNDTAQIDFLNPQAREEVIQKILYVARNFPIIRFDAAMVLAKKHIRRLWYPHPGQGGDISTRSEYALSPEEFEKAIPQEFWREVVDRCAREIPDTLLLAEAFWMMEGYFVRTLGMHRVYNSAFMNMLKKEENYKYRETVKNTLEFDPQVLRRFVNFMNNPDEETAEAQFGKGDKYFGVCTLMITMPGLPMFGHGQIEGYTEKYGMEYQRSYRDETPDQWLIERHEREIFPLMKKRYLFAEVDHFYFYDVWNNGTINENIFAYSNCCASEHSLVLYNNVYECAGGWIKNSCPYAVKNNADEIELHTQTLAKAFDLHDENNAFCIFQEQRSGLWFIRFSKEIAEQGLYIFLNGFESQVLLNVYEVIDDETERYKTLHDELGGKGVHNIEIALQEILYKELYTAFMDFVNPQFLQSIDILCMDTASRKKQKYSVPKLTTVLKNVEPAAKKYFSVLQTFIDGNYGAQKFIGKAKMGKSITLDQAWKAFSKRINAIVDIQKNAENPPTENSPEMNTMYVRAFKELMSRPYAVLLFAGTATLYSIRDFLGNKSTIEQFRSVLYFWGLDRKMSEAILAANEKRTDCNVHTVLQAALDVLPDSFVIKEDSVKNHLFTVLSNLIDSPYAGKTIGKNVYNNVCWFNAEKMNDALWFLHIQCMLATNNQEDVKTIQEMKKSLELAVKKSAYQADILLETYKPTEKQKKKTATAKAKVGKKQ